MIVVGVTPISLLVFGAAHAQAEGGSFYLPSYGTLDLSVGVQSSDGRWHGELWGRNVTNTYYWQSVFYFSETTVREAGMPARVGHWVQAYEPAAFQPCSVHVQ